MPGVGVGDGDGEGDGNGEGDGDGDGEGDGDAVGCGSGFCADVRCESEYPQSATVRRSRIDPILMGFNLSRSVFTEIGVASVCSAFQSSKL